MTVTLAEEVVLLSLDARSGAARRRQAAGWAVAGGILLELVMARRVSVTGKYLELRDPAPTGVRLLDGRIQLIGSWLRGRSKRRVTDWLTKDHSHAVGAVLDSLAERGVVGSEVRKVPGVFPQRRYPGSDAAVERELRERLGRVVLGGAEPDARTAGLISLLHAAGLHGPAFPDRPAREVAPRMGEIAAGQWAGKSVRAAVRDMQAAAVTATVFMASAPV
ncbi:GPP34 family phosphoprotein [Streptomyces sp. NPDC048507]|uniref:GOLPH3/VPS74 family protein n=1 Tax=Streptomyces sp. NPDC048507 TaxID=3365560 RepID=UPI0037159FAD